MRSKFIRKLAAMALFVAAAFPASAQVAASAAQGGLPLVVGTGYSNFGIDWGNGARLEGISAWIDLYPHGLPTRIQGLGIEAEGRDLNYGRPSYLSKMRQDTALMGGIYEWHHYQNFLPDGKYLAGLGSIDFPPIGTYTHDTFLVVAPGGGAEYQAWRNVSVRADYEYQFWHHFLGNHDLNPQGFSVSAEYDFRNHE